MKKRLLILIMLGTLFSCHKKNDKSDFIGNWSSTSNTNFKYDFEFYLDSMVVHNPLISGTYSDKWEVKGDKIELELIRGDKSVLNQEVVIDFRFNNSKDTLFIKNENDSLFVVKLKKIKNSFEYFENSIGLKMDFEKSDGNLISIGQNEFGLNIYAAYKNDKLICKTDYSNNLDSLALETFRFREELTEEEAEKMMYVLFIDNDLNQKDIDSIKDQIPMDILDRVFRIYKYKEKKWNEPIEWFGKYVK